MSLAQVTYNKIEKQIKDGLYQDAVEHLVMQRDDFKEIINAGNTISSDEINLMFDCEKRSLLNEMFKLEYHEKAVEMFTNMIDAFNSSVHTETNKALLEALTTSHRHIQGEFWKNILKVAYQYSQLDDRFFDGRNEFAKEICANICETQAWSKFE